MSTQKETVAYILETLEAQSDNIYVWSRKPHIGEDSDTHVGFTRPNIFTVWAMFGEYVLYCGSKAVALICDDLLYVKITPQSLELELICEKDAPYVGANLHYVVAEEQIYSIKNLAQILQVVSEALLKPKLKVKKLKKM